MSQALISKLYAAPLTSSDLENLSALCQVVILHTTLCVDVHYVHFQCSFIGWVILIKGGQGGYYERLSKMWYLCRKVIL